MICDPRLCYVQVCRFLKQLLHHEEVCWSKEQLPKLPICFEEPLGEAKGAIKQFRGLFGSHVREYSTYWKIHRDLVDPRSDPLGHLVNDAPHILGVAAVLGVIGIAILAVSTSDDNGEGGED